MGQQTVTEALGQLILPLPGKSCGLLYSNLK
jgi:hypothetical protein